VEHKVYLSDECCPMCGGRLVRLDPDWNGWRYWCVYCNVLTMTAREYAERDRELRGSRAIGFVFAIPAPFSREDAERFRRAVQSYEGENTGCTSGGDERGG